MHARKIGRRRNQAKAVSTQGSQPNFSRGIHIRLVGEFDVFRADELADRLRQAEGAPAVIIDLSQATFLDATALGCFVALHHRRNGRGQIHVIGARAHLRRLFAITGLEKTFVFSGDP